MNYRKLGNQSMARKLLSGDAVDVSTCEKDGHHYVLTKFTEGKDYCNAATECWIWSIGRRLSDGVILASVQGDLYQNPNFECLWLR